MSRTDSIPLGKREGLKLEFKSEETLKSPDKIAREVVGMLNADGGDVWIGVVDQDGIATAIERIEDPEDKARALRDSLIDRVEPSPLDDEVALEAMKEGPILVHVRPKSERAPYALLRGGAREFVVRVGDRNRPMSRQEVFDAFNGDVGPQPGKEPRRRITEAKGKQAERRVQTCWIRFEPDSALDLDLDSVSLTKLLQDATASGNRLMGWNFAVPDDLPRVGKQMRWTGIPGYMKTTVFESGAIEFEGDLAMLNWKGEAHEIWPYVLLELPVSIARLASHVYQDCNGTLSARHVFADMALFGIKEWSLRPYSPNSIRFRLTQPRPYMESEDLTWNDPIVVEMDQLEDAPDHVGYRLVRRVYEAFGYREDEIPREYDREGRRLILP